MVVSKLQTDPHSLKSWIALSAIHKLSSSRVDMTMRSSERIFLGQNPKKREYAHHGQTKSSQNLSASGSGVLALAARLLGGVAAFDFGEAGGASTAGRFLLSGVAFAGGGAAPLPVPFNVLSWVMCG